VTPMSRRCGDAYARQCDMLGLERIACYLPHYNEVPATPIAEP